MILLIITTIISLVVGFVIGAVAMIIYSCNKKKSSAHSDDIEGTLEKCKDSIKRLLKNIDRIENEITSNSADTSQLRESIKELESKAYNLSLKATNLSNTVNSKTLNQSIRTPVQENSIAEVFEKTSVAASNPPQQSFVQNNAVHPKAPVQNIIATAMNNSQQLPEVSTSGAASNSVTNSEPNVYSMQQIFQIVKVWQESSPEYRVFNFQTNKIEYSNDKSAQYILSENRRYLIPNFTGPFQKSSLSDDIYICNTDLIYGTNKITLCEVDSNGQVIKKGTIS